MCNRYANRIAYREYVEAFKNSPLKIASPTPDKAPNLEPRDNIFPTDRAPILRLIEGGLELKELRWGLIPHFHKGTAKEWKFLNTNARSETIIKKPSFRESFNNRRCLIPASVYYEWTGEKKEKTKWQFTVAEKPWFCIAGIWDRAEIKDGLVESFAMLTREPSEATVQYHDREPLVLGEAQHFEWLGDPTQALAIMKTPSRVPLIVQRATA